MTQPQADRATAGALPDYDGWDTQAILADLIGRAFPGRIALVSSFGAESAVLLHLVAGIDAGVPVIFLDTGKLFPETLRYRDMLTARFGLRDVRSVRPKAQTLALVDPIGAMWEGDPDRCCWHRKVEPLDEALTGFAAWITGRKRFQGGLREALPIIEHRPDGTVKANPLANWSTERLDRYTVEHDLPRHPLRDRGFRSIGCAPCTGVAAPGQDARAGRWAGSAKTECGIHLVRPVSLAQMGIAEQASDR